MQRIRVVPPTFANMTELREVMIGHNHIDRSITDALSAQGLPGFLRIMKENLLREQRGLPVPILKTQMEAKVLRLVKLMSREKMGGYLSYL